MILLILVVLPAGSNNNYSISPLFLYVVVLRFVGAHVDLLGLRPPHFKLLVQK